MPSYIPEFRYDCDTGSLKPWPAHMLPREPEPAPQPAALHIPKLVEAGGVFFLSLSPTDRAGIAYTIERLINMLDAMEEDPDLEPYLAGAHGGDRFMDLEGSEGFDGDCDREPSLGWAANGDHGAQPCWGNYFGELEADHADDEPMFGWEHGSLPYDQSRLGEGGPDECEHVSEDEGACIQSQPHDAIDEGNDEPFMGWPEKCGQGPVIGIDASPADFDYDQEDQGAGRFNGDGIVAARTVLKNLRRARPDVRQQYVPAAPADGSYEALRVDGLTIKSNKGRRRRSPGEVTILRPGIAMIGGFL